MTTQPPMARLDHDLLVEAVTNIRTLLDRSNDQETRIRALERRITAFSAMASVFGAIGGAYLPHLFH